MSFSYKITTKKEGNQETYLFEESSMLFRMNKGVFYSGNYSGPNRENGTGDALILTIKDIGDFTSNDLLTIYNVIKNLGEDGLFALSLFEGENEIPLRELSPIGKADLVFDNDSEHGGLRAELIII